MNNSTLISTKEYLLFFVVPILLYAGFATDFTFNFFKPFWLWQAYNEFYLSLVDGRLNIPAYAIGREGQYIDGKAYMYYGLLPTITRVIFDPFVDLQKIPVSAFSVWAFSIVGTSYLQYSILTKYKKNTSNITSAASLTMLCCVSLIIWFASGSFIILQEANIYHEPYAASLCLANIYAGLLIKDNFFKHHVKNILPYAVLAGLCTHARMPLALALYVTTVALIFINSYHSYKASPTSIKKTFFMLLSYWPTLLVLFLFGISILGLNYARFDNPLSFMGPAAHYGYKLTGEVYSARTCNIISSNELSGVLRIIPNAIVYGIGGWNLHDKLMALFQTGYGRKELPLIPIFILWMAPLFLILLTFIQNIKNKNIIKLLIMTGFSIGVVFQLSYPTIAHRYIAELWPIFLIALVTFYFAFIKNPKSINRTTFYIIIMAAVLSIIYNIYIAFSSGYHFRPNIEPMTVYSYSPEITTLLENITDDKVLEIKQSFIDGKESGCEALKKQLLTDKKH